MKTDKEWAQEMPCVFPEERQFIRAIQADALRHAADRADNASDWGHWKPMSDLRDELRAAAAALEKEKK